MGNIRISSVDTDIEHQNAFSQAMETILAHPRTEHTMAQLVDGLPQADVALQSRGHHLGVRDHPLRNHVLLCDEVLEKTQSLRDNFDLNSLDFEPHVSLLSSYAVCHRQNAHPDPTHSACEDF